MRKHEFVGHLRRIGIWSAARRLHRYLGPPICALFHSLVMVFGRRLFSTDLVLKHLYDRQLLHVQSDLIQTVVNVGGWRRPEVQQTWWQILKNWFLLGDGLKTTRRHFSRNLHGRFVVGGDWDLEATAFDILPVLDQLFVQGLKPQETDRYKHYLGHIQSGQLAWTKGLRTPADLDDYFALLTAIFEDMRRNGYRTQNALGQDGSDEIRICVDRHGRPCIYGGGTHRLSMAKLLELESVPVIVKRVHRSWVEDNKRRHGTDSIVEATALGLKDLEGAGVQSPTRD